MEGDRQSQIDALVRSALARKPEERVSFLAEACSDRDLLAEVSRTLTHLHQETRPPSGALPSDHAEHSASRPHDHRIEATYGVYRVSRRIGSGGMGEVYLAFDTRLGRQVALKFLPADTAADDNIVRRFQSEARTASALNHPNILTIFDAGKFERDHYIASEFVEGITLRARMRRGPIDLGEALEIAVQIASALVAAHSANVVHRDLKPTNIMLRPDGYVKVIDFGLAKRPRAVAEAEIDEAYTRPGAMVGTVDYMSPEQARGEEVDARSDLWSFGIVLYEMLAGERPFTGRSEFEVVARVLGSEPRPLSGSGARAVPPEVQHILERCLDKDRDTRYQTAAELHSDLRAVRRELNFSSITHHSMLVQRPFRLRRRAWFAAAAAAAILVAAAIWWFTAGSDRFLGPQPFEIGRTQQVTFKGITKLAVVSPDGRYLAYVWGAPEHEQLSIAQIRDGKVDPNSDSVRIQAAGFRINGLVFSNDSQSLFYLRRKQEQGSLYRIPITGGEDQLITSPIDGPPAVSPFADAIAYRVNRKGTADLILRGGAYGSNGRTVLEQQGVIEHRIAWSKRGDRIALFVYPGAEQHKLQLEIFNPRTERITRTVEIPGWRGVSQPAWMPNGRDLIVASGTPSETDDNLQIRIVSSRTGRTLPVTNDLFGYFGASLSDDGRELVTVRRDRQTYFWFADSNDLSSGRIRSADSARYDSVAWTDHLQLVAQANRGNGENVWLIDPAGGVPRMLTDGQSRDRSPVWVPRQRAIIFASDRDGQSGIWRWDADRAAYTILASTKNFVESPACTPDGSNVIYTMWEANDPSVWIVPSAGGSAPKLLIRHARAAQISPDAQHLLAEVLDSSTRSDWRLTVFAYPALTPERDVSGIPSGSKVQWHPGSAALDYVRFDESGVANLWSIDLRGAPPKRLTSFQESQIFDFAWSVDGSRLVCLRGRVSSDAILITPKPGLFGRLFAN